MLSVKNEEKFENEGNFLTETNFIWKDDINGQKFLNLNYGAYPKELNWSHSIGNCESLKKIYESPFNATQFFGGSFFPLVQNCLRLALNFNNSLKKLLKSKINLNLANTLKSKKLE